MSWLQKLLPPKINRAGTGAKKTVPEGLWSKCPSCSAVLYAADRDANDQVCPKCDYHNRIGARTRLDGLLDPEGRFEIGAEVAPLDTLKFKDSKRYADRLQDAENNSGESEALVVMQGSIKSIPVVIALHLLCCQRWRADAGRHALLDADGQDDGVADTIGGAETAFHFRTDRPDHWRRIGELCVSGRCRDR